MNRNPVFALLACGLSLTFLAGRASGGDATVERMEGGGEVVVLRALRQIPVPGGGFVLQPKDVLVSSPAVTTFIHHRGAELVLAPGSRLRLLPESAGTTAPLATVEILAGAMRVTNDGPASLPLSILTPACACEIGAAKAVVELRDGTVCVSAVSGQVRVRANDPRRDLGAVTAVLDPAQQALVPAMGLPSRPGPIDAAEMLRLEGLLERGRADGSATGEAGTRPALETELRRASFTGSGLDAIRTPVEEARLDAMREVLADESAFRFPRPSVPPGSTR